MQALPSAPPFWQFELVTGAPELKSRATLIPKYQLPCVLAMGVQALTKNCCPVETLSAPFFTVSVIIKAFAEVYACVTGFPESVFPSPKSQLYVAPLLVSAVNVALMPTHRLLL